MSRFPFVGTGYISASFFCFYIFVCRHGLTISRSPVQGVLYVSYRISISHIIIIIQCLDIGDCFFHLNHFHSRLLRHICLGDDWNLIPVFSGMWSHVLLVGMNQRFTGTYCLCPQCRRAISLSCRRRWHITFLCDVGVCQNSCPKLSEEIKQLSFYLTCSWRSTAIPRNRQDSTNFAETL